MRRAPTPETTRLGGGIGFHGWAREWEDAGPRHLSRGCVVPHLSDISDFYDRLPEGSLVFIFQPRESRPVRREARSLV